MLVRIVFSSGCQECFLSRFCNTTVAWAAKSVSHWRIRLLERKAALTDECVENNRSPASEKQAMIHPYWFPVAVASHCNRVACAFSTSTRYWETTQCLWIEWP